MERFESDPISIRLQAEYKLRVLSLCVDRAGGSPQIVVRVTAPGTDGGIDDVAVLTCGYGEIGLPMILGDEGPPEGAFWLPDYFAHALEQAISQLALDGEPLWLRLTPPVGLLPIVPWERLLAPIVKGPILRLPYHEISPRRPKNNFDCVVCFSSPAAKEMIPAHDVLPEILDRVPGDLVKFATIHVFADADVQGTLEGIRQKYTETFDLRIYDPLAAEETPRRPARTYSRGVRQRNPWLNWMQSALKDRSADVVHFVSHCLLSGEEGGLALAESPLANADRSSARFIWADELTAFLNEVGAWSMALTSPRGNYSLTGMRMLQDEVARLRPGPCLLHDMAEPASPDALGAAYRFLYLAEWHPAPASGAVSLYCHPWHQARDQRPDQTSEAILHDLTLAGRVDLFAAPGHVWLTTAQRGLEQSATQLSAAGASEEDLAVASGRKDALRFVAEALARHSMPADAIERPEEPAIDEEPDDARSPGDEG